MHPERTFTPISGWIPSFVCLALAVTGAVLLVNGLVTENGVRAICGPVAVAVGVIGLCGLMAIALNQARVPLLFGEYTGNAGSLS